MPKTITALYDSLANAQAAIATLATAGIPRTTIDLFDGAPLDAMARTGAPAPAALPPATAASLRDASLSGAERELYDAALRRGSILLRLSIEETEVARALNILRDHGSVDLEARLASWRREGWGGTSPVSTEGWGGYSATSTSGKGVAEHSKPDIDG